MNVSSISICKLNHEESTHFITLTAQYPMLVGFFRIIARPSPRLLIEGRAEKARSASRLMDGECDSHSSMLFDCTLSLCAEAIHEAAINGVLWQSWNCYVQVTLNFFQKEEKTLGEMIIFSLWCKWKAARLPSGTEIISIASDDSNGWISKGLRRLWRSPSSRIWRSQILIGEQ